jgi:hypothetical protein
VSKYRVEFISSRILVILQLLNYVFLVLSVLSWQHAIIQYQFILQAGVVFIITLFLFRTGLHRWRQTRSPVIFSVKGEWMETAVDGQVVWKITNSSRVSSIVLFIHLISPLNARHSKWCLIYKDQVTKRDFSRLCRSVLYQQQTAGED